MRQTSPSAALTQASPPPHCDPEHAIENATNISASACMHFGMTQLPANDSACGPTINRKLVLPRTKREAYPVNR
jgi:hypothetical protein